MRRVYQLSSFLSDNLRLYGQFQYACDEGYEKSAEDKGV